MKRTRMLPVILCVAVVVVAAALVWHRQTAQPVLDPLLAETLSVSDQEQKSLAEAVQTIDQTDSADGLTVTVKQAITYPQMLCLLVELTYPDPIDPATLPEDDSILPGSYTVTVNGTPIGGHSSCLLPAWDDSKTEPANTFPFRIRFLSDAPFFEQGQTCTLTLRDFPLQSDALPDDIFVQICLDLTGGGDGVGHIGVDHLPLRRRHVLQNIHAQVDTLIADVRAGAGNDLGHLVLVLAAEGAANGSFFIVFGQNRFTSF